jgi:hypothetical protein
MQLSNEEQLRIRAYKIWERQGCPSGKDQEIWELAVREMEGQAPPQVEEGPWRTPQEERSKGADANRVISHRVVRPSRRSKLAFKRRPADVPLE